MVPLLLVCGFVAGSSAVGRSAIVLSLLGWPALLVAAGVDVGSSFTTPVLVGGINATVGVAAGSFVRSVAQRRRPSTE